MDKDLTFKILKNPHFYNKEALLDLHKTYTEQIEQDTWSIFVSANNKAYSKHNIDDLELVDCNWADTNDVPAMLDVSEEALAISTAEIGIFKQLRMCHFIIRHIEEHLHKLEGTEYDTAHQELFTYSPMRQLKQFVTTDRETIFKDLTE